MQTSFRITHGGGAVAFDGAEITVAIHEGFPFFEILAHNNEGFINGTVPVRMVFTHCIADNTGGFTVGFIIADTQFVHIIKGTALNRFQTVTHIGQRRAMMTLMA